MSGKMKKIIFLSFCLIFLSFVFYSGFYFGKLNCQKCPPQDIDFSLFWEAYDKLKENFIDTKKINPKEIIYGAISGMVKSFGDPYTTFFTPTETQKFEEEVKGVFEGVGMEIGIKNKKLTVIAPLEGTPAKRAGILAGDQILKIDEKLTDDMSIEEAVSLIRGPKGTKVKLTIYRKGWEEPKEIELEREIIKIPTLTFELKEDGIAYIKIHQFYSERTAPEFAKVANQILKSQAKKIILDLRDNPGGALDQVIEVAGWFLEKGEVVAIEEKKDGEKEFLKSPGPARLSIYPIVVLINGGSASGAEILAGALRDQKGVKLIGENSFGKGSVQQPFSLSDNSTLKITVAKWLTPKGISISEEGLKPDIFVKMTEEDFEKGFDPQLEKAIEILKEKS